MLILFRTSKGNEYWVCQAPKTESSDAVLQTNIQEYPFKLFTLKKHTGSVELLRSRESDSADQSQFNCMAL